MTQIFILSGTSWTVPSDWNSSNNSVEVIGAGGGGQTADPSYAGSGGGGGAYSKITNVSLSGGSNIAIQVGTGGPAGTPGGDTWFNGANLSTSSAGAKGGGGGSDLTGGAGGDQASGIGAIKFSGGNGASPGPNPWTGGGGAGAAGPNGAGANAGSPNNLLAAGAGGGGGNGGGSIGADGDSSGNGGAGGNGNSGLGGGSPDSGSGAGGGTAGTGGGGGGAKYLSQDNGGNGATGNEFDNAHGSGGGGGGGGGRGEAAAGNGGAGANYGGGGGGGGYPQTGTAWGIGGSGGDGIIVVTYSPAATTMIAADSRAGLEMQTTERKDETALSEFGLTVPFDGRTQVEVCRGIQRGSASWIEFPAAVRVASRFPAESAGAIAVTAEALAWVEITLRSGFSAIAPIEWLSRLSSEVSSLFEWSTTKIVDFGQALELGVTLRAAPKLTSAWATRIIADPRTPAEALHSLFNDAELTSEFLAGTNRANSLVLEFLTSGIFISVPGWYNLEWADPPALPLISHQRMLRSPGKIRVLSGYGSLHPLRGQ